MNFQPKVSHSDAKLFYIVFGLMFLMGLAAVIFTKGSQGLIGWIIIGFSGLILFLMWQQNAAFDMRYLLLEEGVFLKRFFWKKIIPYSELQKVEILNESEATALIRGKYREEVQERNKLSFTAFTKRKRVNETIQFISVPVILSSTNSGIKISNFNVRVSGDFILLQTTNGQQYLITPLMAEGFVNEIRKRISVKN